MVWSGQKCSVVLWLLCLWVHDCPTDFPRWGIVRQDQCWGITSISVRCVVACFYVEGGVIELAV